jgi:hypothetical protein
MDGLPCVSSTSFIFRCLNSEHLYFYVRKTWFVIMLNCEPFMYCNVVLWSRLRVGLAHISILL